MIRIRQSFLLLLLIAFAQTVFSASAVAQASKQEKPANAQKSGAEVRSVAELKLGQGRRNGEVVAFDVEATLLLYDPRRSSTRFWDQGRKLLGDIPQELIGEPKLGSKVRIVGRSIPGLFRVRIDRMEIVGEGDLPSPRVIAPETKSIDSKLIGLYCRILGQVNEVFSRPGNQQVLVRNRGGFFGWYLRSDMPIDRVKSIVGRTVAADGVVVEAQEDEIPACALIAIEAKQLKLREVKAGETKEMPGFHSIHGQVIAKDHRNWVAIADENEVVWVRSAFADQVKLGVQITAFYVDFNDTTDDKTGLARVLRVDRPGPLPLPEPSLHRIVSVSKRTTKAANRLVTVEGTVRTVVTRPGGIEVRMSDGDGNWCNLLFDKRFPPQKKILVAGNVIRASGVRRGVPNKGGGPVEFRLIVNEGQTAKLISKPFRFYSQQLGLVGLVLFTVLAGFGCWTYLLRGRVRDRTQDMNSLAARLQASCDVICEGIMFFDRDGRLSQTTGLADKLLTDGSQDFVDSRDVGRFASSLFNESDQFSALWESAFQDKAMIARDEFSMVGNDRVLAFRTAPIANNDNRFDGRIWTVADITEQKRMESEVLNAKKLQAVGQLAGGVAHDFNNLLMAISANVSLAELEKQNPDKVARHLAIASDAVDRAASLTQELLGFSRQSQLSFRPVSVGSLLEHVGVLVRHLLPTSTSLALQTIDDDLYMMADAAQIERVITNICLNARDAIHGPGEIVVSAEPVKHPTFGEVVAIKVKDNGKGMTPALTERIFEPFFSTKEVGGGTGLGLAVAFGIVRQHQGMIECRSQVESGTVFTVMIPRAGEAEMAAPSIRMHVDPKTNSRRILLVDDDVMIRDAATALLSSVGHQVVTASDGKVASNLLKNDSDFDLVLLDWTMPVQAGEATLQQIRSDFADLPVVICSGLVADARQAISEEGLVVQDFLQKPFRVEDLRQVIQKHALQNDRYDANDHQRDQRETA